MIGCLALWLALGNALADEPTTTEPAPAPALEEPAPLAIPTIPPPQEPWEPEYRRGQKQAVRGAIFGGAGVVALGTGMILQVKSVSIQDTQERNRVLLVGRIFQIGGGIPLFSGAPTMALGSRRARNALKNGGITVTNAPALISDGLYLGVTLGTLVLGLLPTPRADQVEYNRAYTGLWIGDMVGLFAAYGLAGVQVQINSSAYGWFDESRDAAHAPTSKVKVDLRLAPFASKEGSGLALTGHW